MIFGRFYIAEVKNSAADYLSRFSHLHKYYLSETAFSTLINLIPFDLNIDLFASKDNFKITSYASLMFDEKAKFSNAFSAVWCSGSYLFPPLPLISKVVSKLFRDDVDSAVLITPA